jgi:hypothetical protein
VELDPSRAVVLNAPRRACAREGRSKDDAATRTARACDDGLDVRGVVGVVGDRGAVTLSPEPEEGSRRPMADRDI